MKVRDTHSFERAIREIVEIVGEDALAEGLDRSPSLIRKWTDPDHPSLPSLAQAFDLDKQYISKTNQPGPIGAVYLYQLEHLSNGTIQDAEPLSKSIMDVFSAVGAIAMTMNGFLDGTSEPDKISARDRDTILDQIERIHKELDALERCVRQRSS